ncbi:MAG TPA: serine hydrolase domain-containing protein [Gemmatimonadales bacterium]|nr:serine hydrolase domain-containing protein [Gemmatimonadales bacterium]
MMRASATLPAFTLILVPSLVLGQSRDTAMINRYVQAEMQRQQIPGVSLAVLTGDRVLMARGYGFANVELKVPASDSTIYQSGSVGKQFTAALVEMLVGQQKLRLDDPIVRWFPEGASVWQGITVRHLLTHTSGIAEYTDSTFNYRKDYTEDELVKFAASRPLDFRPGERWSYSNTGYLLLGALIHRVSGRFYGGLLRDSIFKPLGMNDSRIISEADIVPNRADGYVLDDGVLKNQEWVAPSLNTTADGALYLTVRDLVKWAVALNHKRVPSAAALDTAWTPVRLNDGATYPYGFGWGIFNQRGHLRIAHTGSWQGFKTVIARYPDSGGGLTVIVLANLAQAQVGAIAYGIAGILDAALAAPHLATWSGPQPPAAIPALLRDILANPDSARITSRFRRFLSSDLNDWYKTLVAPARQWTLAGCDAVGSRHIAYLGTDVAYICHARAARPSGGGTVVSVLYSADWRAAGIEGYAY